jgi:catechol-2,3-dioxygenase
MNLRRKFLKFLAVSPFFANYNASAQTSTGAQLDNQAGNLTWGHININVSDLDASIEFYEKLGFEFLSPQYLI